MAGAPASVNILKQMQRAFNALAQGHGFDRILQKISIVSASKGRCIAELTVGEEHLNGMGTLHGGLTATAIDVLTACALMASDENVHPGVTTDLHINLMNGARPGDQIVFDSKSLKTGKTLAYMSCTVTNKVTGDILYTGTQTRFIGIK